jgi:hypothetical protein
METKFQTSFIPKKPVVEERRMGSSISLFLLLSIIIFLVSLGMGVWVYIQKDMLIKNIEKSAKEIKVNKNSFELSSIEDIIRLNLRIKTAENLLDKHISIAPVFNFLEKNTLKQIRFKNFSFSSSGKDEKGNPSVKVTMTGQALASPEAYKIISLQADIFGSQQNRAFVRNTLLSDLSLGSDGGVSFSASMNVLPDYLSYSSSKKNTNIDQ